MSRPSPTAPYTSTTFRKWNCATTIANEVHNIPSASISRASTTCADKWQQRQQLSDADNSRDKPAAVFDATTDTSSSSATILRAQQLLKDECATSDTSTTAAEKQRYLASAVDVVVVVDHEK